MALPNSDKDKRLVLAAVLAPLVIAFFDLMLVDGRSVIKNLKGVLFGFLVVLLLSGCLPEESSPAQSEKIEIREGMIGGRKYYVPDAYLFPLTKEIGPEAMLLQIHYPTYAPLFETTDEMWKKGELWKSFRVLVTYMPSPKKAFHEHAIEMTKGKAATETVGVEYGLIHKTQRQDPNTPSLWQLDDVWFEEKNGKYVSYTTCSERKTEMSVPICKLFFRLTSHLSMRITFNKQLLPDWHDIKGNAIGLYESFRSAETAQEFLTSRVNYAHEMLKEN